MPTPTKIMFIRHAEKPGEPPPPHGVDHEGKPDTSSLTVRGWIRAGALSLLFDPPNQVFSHPHLATPQVVYSVYSPQGSGSHRPQETVSPLLDKLGDRARANFNFAKGQETEMVTSVLAEQGAVLICWEHKLLVQAAHQIPLSPHNAEPVPAEWDEVRFDLVWIFDLDPVANAYTFTQISQFLLQGDRQP